MYKLFVDAFIEFYVFKILHAIYFQEEVIPRVYRTVNPTISQLIEKEISSLFTRQCLKTYTKDWHVINYKYKSYSGSYLQLPR